ncbi:MAG: hypothetical protein KJ592_03205 [Nanoarchaeota archaeon]|nr:hypothetical protein [Nanoarchaeota archaeon]
MEIGKREARFVLLFFSFVLISASIVRSVDGGCLDLLVVSMSLFAIIYDIFLELL